jgi:hypothetical protein
MCLHAGLRHVCVALMRRPIQIAGAALLLALACVFIWRSGRATVAVAAAAVAPVEPTARWQSPLGHTPPSPRRSTEHAPSAAAALADPPLAPRVLALPNGMRATIQVSRSRYPAGHPIAVRLDLQDAKGEPVTAWAGAAVMVHDENNQAWHKGLSEDGDVPGRYSVLLTPKTWSRGKLAVEVMLAASGNLADPQQWLEEDYAIDYGTPASLHPAPRGILEGDVLKVSVPVRATRDTTAELRAELWDTDGTLLGEAVGQKQLRPGQNSIELAFPSVAPLTTAASYWLGAATLVTVTAGQAPEASDVLEKPAFISLRQ